MPIETELTERTAQWTWRDARPGRRLAVLVASVAVLTVFGPGVLALGTAEVVISCQRAGSLTCEADERFLFGLIHRRHHAEGVTGLDSSWMGDEGASRLQLRTGSTTVPLSVWGASTSPDAQRRLARQFHRALATGATTFQAQESMWSVLGLFGAVMSGVWALTLWALVRLPWHVATPAMVRVDRLSRRLQVRARAGGPVQELPPGEVVTVSTTRNPGGWLGAFLARPRTEDGVETLPPLHVALGLASGQRVVVQNDLELDDDTVWTTARDLASAAGCRHLEHDAPEAPRAL